MFQNLQFLRIFEQRSKLGRRLEFQTQNLVNKEEFLVNINEPYLIKISRVKEYVLQFQLQNFKLSGSLQQKSISLIDQYNKTQKISSNIYNYFKFDFPMNEEITVNFTSSCRLPIFFTYKTSSTKGILLNETNGQIDCLFFNKLGQQSFKEIELNQNFEIDNILEPNYDSSRLLTGKIQNKENEQLYGIIYCILQVQQLQVIEFDIIRQKLGKTIQQDMNQGQESSQFQQKYTLQPFDTLIFKFNKLHKYTIVEIFSDHLQFFDIQLNALNHNQPISNQKLSLHDHDHEHSPSNTYQKNFNEINEIDMQIQNTSSEILEFNFFVNSYENQQSNVNPYLIIVYIIIPILIIIIILIILYQYKKTKDKKKKKLYEEKSHLEQTQEEEIFTRIMGSQILKSLKNQKINNQYLLNQFQNLQKEAYKEQVQQQQPQKKQTILLQELYCIPEVDSTQFKSTLSHLKSNKLGNSVNIFQDTPKMNKQKFNFDQKEIIDQQINNENNEDDFKTQQIKSTNFKDSLKINFNTGVDNKNLSMDIQNIQNEILSPQIYKENEQNSEIQKQQKQEKIQTEEEYDQDEVETKKNLHISSDNLSKK